MAAAPSDSPFPEESKRPRIFISHSRADSKRARELYETVLAVGTPWMDLHDLGSPRDSWEEKTRAAISAADVAIVCLAGKMTSRSGYAQTETELILQAAADKPYNFVIPVRFDDSQPPRILADYVYIDLFDGSGYEKLFAALEGIRQYIDAGDPSPASVAQPSTQYVQVPSIGTADSEPQADERDPEGDEVPADPVIADQQFPGELLREGSTGPSVAAVQTRLKELGFNVFADGTYGPSTEKAVLEFQRKNKLRSTDGLVGPNTWAALFTPGTGDIKPETSQTEPAAKTSPSKDPESVKQGTSEQTQISKEGLSEDARERNALNDKPVDDVTKDTLGFRDYVFALRDFIASQSTTTPLTLSINGAWGSGKSSLMRMVQNQLEPVPERGLWWIKTKWLAGYSYATFFWWAAQILIRRDSAKADYLKLGWAFEPGEDVTKENFDRLFAKYVDESLRDFAAQDKKPGWQERLEDERKRRIAKTRFWARQAARRRKMTPRSHPTIWFNAWKFNQQEQVWAALATAVLDQLKKKYNFVSRLFFLGTLTWKRTDKLKTISQLGRKLVIPLALAFVVALFHLYRENLKRYIPIPQLPGGWSSSVLLWLAPVLTAMWQALKAVDNPFTLPVDELVDRPDYKSKIGFIGTFEEDFARIIDVAIRRSFFWQPRKLIIFIDDLDRCSPNQTAGIVEAVNLFLDSVGCVFVLGMDMNAVAISIEVKYKELTERMRKDAPDNVSPGVLFLDKIVQIPFNVPRPNKAYIEALVKNITEPVRRELPAVRTLVVNPAPSPNGAPTTRPAMLPDRSPGAVRPSTQSTSLPASDRAGFAQNDIREAISFASHMLKENPRQIKRFINLFRLQVYIAHERGMLSDRTDGLSPRTLAVWVAWYMQWPDLLKLLANTAQTDELSEYIANLGEEIEVPHESDGLWRLPPARFEAYLNQVLSLAASKQPLSWSLLPWHVWLRDSDFLRCLKELERFWRRPRFLESMFDMTQVTVSPEALPSSISPESVGSVVQTPAVSDQLVSALKVREK